MFNIVAYLHATNTYSIILPCPNIYNFVWVDAAILNVNLALQKRKRYTLAKTKERTNNGTKSLGKSVYGSVGRNSREVTRQTSGETQPTIPNNR
jgi:hypothetical protein